MPTARSYKGDDGGDHGRNLVFNFDFDRQTVRVDTTPFGLVIDVPNGRLEGTPGGPALPMVAVEAALPPGTAVRETRVEIGASEVIAEGQVVVPLQPAAPGVRICSHLERLRDDGLVTPWPRPKPVPPDPERFKEAIARGKWTATITNVDGSGLQPVVTLTLRPIVLTDNGAVMLHTSIRVTFVLEDQLPTSDKEPGQEPTRFSSHAQAERWVELTKSRVINPATVVDIAPIIGLFSRAEYLIITDNQRWDAATMRPIGPAGGDLEAEFERLAAWKRMKGLSARVVTITEIVNGNFGNFMGWCRRDLQEVLREFVKYAHANWGTAWLLLGGDIDIVPTREIVGYAGGFSPGTTDPPTPGTSFWTGSFLKIRADVGADMPLLRSSDGRRIPYDAAGTSSATELGWIFTDVSYTMRSTMPTGFVRVNGPAAQVNSELFWLTDDNRIPTDLYYADVAGYPERSASGHFGTTVELKAFGAVGRRCGGHDWDDVGNGLYGQWNSDGDLDGVHYRADISVGRAPASSAAEARTFVDKVRQYEGAPNYFLSTSWLNKLLMVSANWGGRSGYGPANPLVDNTYIKRSGEDHAVIQLGAAPSSFNYKLVSVVSDADQREIPLRFDASPSVRGWRFARSATDPSMSVIPIPLPWGLVQFPLPSQWIVVYGAAAEMAPTQFILDESVADGSMLDQETLRTQLATDVPNWSNVRRLYEDEIDLPPPAVGATPIEHLTGDRLRARLNEGQHIVSLSGHGYWGGCCGLEPSMKTSLTNGGYTFIAYADSCLTNQFDFNDAISEALVQNDHGGAVAYVGNTRFSWIDVGDDFQRNFFKGLPAVRALGLLNDRRLTMVNANTGYWQIYNRWSIFSLNLIGDPEMRVWTRRPRGLCLELLTAVRVDDILTVKVMLDEQGVSGAVVTVQQEGFMRQARTDRTGHARLDLAGSKAAELAVTAFHPRAAVLTSTITAHGPVWIDAEIVAIRSGFEDGVVVIAKIADAERRLSVAPGRADLLAVLGQGIHCERRMRLLVGQGDAIEAAEILAAPDVA